jgi:hypothetical protein
MALAPATNAAYAVTRTVFNARGFDQAQLECCKNDEPDGNNDQARQPPKRTGIIASGISLR